MTTLKGEDWREKDGVIRLYDSFSRVRLFRHGIGYIFYTLVVTPKMRSLILIHPY